MSEYICALSENVERTHVRYPNRYGLMLAGDLYMAKGMDKTKPQMALIVGAPYGGVKEQGPCVYASELAQRGFVVLTFDPCYMGESEGEPRHVSSPELFTENFSAGVDFLGLQPFVDREKIAALGICGSGGFALAAAQVDTRIRAVVTTSMYDMSVAARLGQTPEQILAAKQALAEQRWKDAENGYMPEYIPFFPETPMEKVPEGMEEPTAEWFRFYAVKRGHHVRARGGFTTTSNIPLINFDLLSHLDEISPRPILFVVGDRAHSRFFSEEAYAKALEPKELYVVEDAEHIDLYDRTDRIPFDKIEEFLKSNFKVTAKNKCSFHMNQTARIKSIGFICADKYRQGGDFMKKIGCFLLAGVFVACLAACGFNRPSASDAGNLSTVGNSAQEVTEDAQLSESDSSIHNSNKPSSVGDRTNTEGASSDADISMEDETSNEESGEEAIMQQNTFYVTVGGETFSATFADNAGAQALKELLADKDITIQMSDYGSFEKVGSLGHSLPTENSQITTQAGDIVLYQGNQIVIFYGSNSWSYTRLGKIDDLTVWEEALGNGTVTVTLSLQS